MEIIILRSADGKYWFRVKRYYVTLLDSEPFDTKEDAIIAVRNLLSYGQDKSTFAANTVMGKTRIQFIHPVTKMVIATSPVMKNADLALNQLADLFIANAHIHIDEIVRDVTEDQIILTQDKTTEQLLKENNRLLKELLNLMK